MSRWLNDPTADCWLSTAWTFHDTEPLVMCSAFYRITKITYSVLCMQVKTTWFFKPLCVFFPLQSTDWNIELEINQRCSQSTSTTWSVKVLCCTVTGNPGVAILFVLINVGDLEVLRVQCNQTFSITRSLELSISPWDQKVSVYLSHVLQYLQLLLWIVFLRMTFLMIPVFDTYFFIEVVQLVVKVVQKNGLAL